MERDPAVDYRCHHCNGDALDGDHGVPVPSGIPTYIGIACVPAAEPDETPYDFVLPDGFVKQITAGTIRGFARSH